VHEWPNLRALIRGAQYAGEHVAVVQMTYLMFDYFYAAGQTTDWLDVLGVALRSAHRTGNRRARATLLNHSSVAYSRLGQNVVAVQHLHQGLDLLDRPEDRSWRISLLGNLASTLREAKEYEAALPPALEAWDLVRQCDSGTYYQAATDDVLCELYAEQGGWSEAVRHGEPGLESARRGGSKLLEANLLINLGLAWNGLGDSRSAQECFADALGASESVGDRYHEGLALFGLARVRARDSRQVSGEVAELAGRALLRFQELGCAEAQDVLDFMGRLSTRATRASGAAGDLIGVRLSRSSLAPRVVPGSALVHLGDGKLVAVQIPEHEPVMSLSAHPENPER
jgi:tetratricopeptide (TPR) repeat protein